MTKIAQIPLGTAPYRTGRYAAMLDITQEALSERFGLIFERIRDDLGDLDVASIHTEAGIYALLGFYLDAPKKGVDVYLREDSKDPCEELKDVLRSIGATDEDIIWSDFGE